MKQLLRRAQYLPLLIGCLTAKIAVAQVLSQSPVRMTVPRDSVQMPAWQPHPTLKGAASMTLAGDRTKPGMFTIRVKYPDGLHIPPHKHILELHSTVLQGMLCVGLGETWDSTKIQRIMPGQFMYFAPGVSHFEYTVGETILQISGIGPMQTTFNDTTQKPFVQPTLPSLTQPRTKSK